MKKSKVLVPALGVLCLGMAAAVTGTVAWFTTNNTVSAATMSVNVKDLKDLRISVTGTGSWKAALSSPDDAWIDQLTNGGLAVGYDGELTSPTAIFNVLNVSGAGTAIASLKFAKPSETNAIEPANGGAAHAFETGKDMSGYYVASSEYTHGDYELLYAGSDAATTISTTIKIGSTSTKNIDAAVVIATIVDSKIYTYILPTYSGGYADITGPAITLNNGVKKQFDIYVWYDGTSSAAKNENAVKNVLNFEVEHSLA